MEALVGHPVDLWLDDNKGRTRVELWWEPTPVICRCTAVSRRVVSGSSQRS